MNDDTIKGICDSIMRAFGAAFHSARDGAPIRRAKDALGSDRFVEVARRTMAERITVELTGAKAKQNEEDLRGPASLYAVQAIVTGIVADVFTACIRESGIKVEARASA
jgi:hypothetical protein